MSGWQKASKIIGIWLKYFTGGYTKLERELAIGCVANHERDQALNKEWEPTLRDGL